ncbi:MAG TPA: MarR family transcriptional regulator [Caulobacteraceae bacterium]|jgi:DNA-binding MarR family transcriptional regulator
MRDEADDYVVELGLPLTAHRLRRASELLVDAYGRWLAEVGPDVPPRALSTMMLLDETGPQGVTQIARRLRFTHPLMIELTRALEAKGFVSARTDPADARRRLLELTPSGRAAAGQIRERLQTLEAFYKSLFDEIGVDLLDAVERLETAARKRPLIERIEEAQNRSRAPAR